MSLEAMARLQGPGTNRGKRGRRLGRGGAWRWIKGRHPGKQSPGFREDCGVEAPAGKVPGPADSGLEWRRQGADPGTEDYLRFEAGIPTGHGRACEPGRAQVAAQQVRGRFQARRQGEVAEVEKRRMGERGSADHRQIPEGIGPADHRTRGAMSGAVLRGGVGRAIIGRK